MDSAMTISSMLLFKKQIKNSDLPEHDKALVWAVSTIAFAGAFRIHEILARAESTFDPSFTLLTGGRGYRYDSFGLSTVKFLSSSFLHPFI